MVLYGVTCYTKILKRKTKNKTDNNNKMGLWSKTVKRSVTGDDRLENVDINMGILDSIRIFINKTLNHRFNKEHDWCTFEVKNKNEVHWTICGYHIPFKPKIDDVYFIFTQLKSRIKSYTEKSNYMNTLYKVMERNSKDYGQFKHIQEDEDEDRLLNWE